MLRYKHLVSSIPHPSYSSLPLESMHALSCNRTAIFTNTLKRSSPSFSSSASSSSSSSFSSSSPSSLSTSTSTSSSSSSAPTATTARLRPQQNHVPGLLLAAFTLGAVSLYSYSTSSSSSSSEASSSSLASPAPLISSALSSFLSYFFPTVECTSGVTTKKWHFYRGKPERTSVVDLRLISGSAHKQLAEEIALYLDIPLTKATVGQFSDGEVQIAILENVRESHCFIVAPVCAPVNDTLTELLLLISTLRRASVAEITVVAPYLGYSRQDIKMRSRVPISFADVALMLTAMGADRIVTVDLHNGQSEGFFPPSVPVINLQAVFIGALHFAEKDLHQPVVVAPSPSSVLRSKTFREQLQIKSKQDVDLALLIENKYHDVDEGGRLIGVAANLDLIGEVRGRDCILIEDITDSGRSFARAAQELAKNGAKRVFAFSSHGLLTDGALETIAECDALNELIICNTTPYPANADNLSKNKITQLTIAPLLAEAIVRIYRQQSILSLFDPQSAQSAIQGAEETLSTLQASPTVNSDNKGM